MLSLSAVFMAWSGSDQEAAVGSVTSYKHHSLLQQLPTTEVVLVTAYITFFSGQFVMFYSVLSKLFSADKTHCTRIR